MNDTGESKSLKLDGLFSVRMRVRYFSSSSSYVESYVYLFEYYYIESYSLGLPYHRAISFD